MTSLVSNKVLLYAFVALAIVCVVASIFTMSFSLFFVTVVVCIVVYIVYQVTIERQTRLRDQERLQLQEQNKHEDEDADEDEDGDEDRDEDVAQPMPVVVQAAPAQLVVDQSQEKRKKKKGRRRRRKNDVADPTPEDIERARLLSLRSGPSRTQKTYNRVNKTRGPNTLQVPNARVITKLSGRKQAFSDMHLDKFAGRNELQPRRKRPNRAADSSGYGQLSSWRADPNRSVSENAAKRAMTHGAILPEPKHARRRLMTGILKRFPARPAPGMVRIPEGTELPCNWKK